MYAGRLVAGFGVGAASMLTPLVRDRTPLLTTRTPYFIIFPSLSSQWTLDLFYTELCRH